MIQRLLEEAAGSTTVPRQIEFQTELVVRASTAGGTSS